MDMAEQASVEEDIEYSRHMMRHGIAGSYLNLVLVSWVLSALIWEVAVLVCIPTNSE